MSDAPPMIELTLSEAMQPSVVIEESVEVSTIAELTSEAPALMQAEAAERLALSVNHLAVGTGFEVITDPAAFRSAYEAQLASEDPDAPWREGVQRLIDYGVPEFDAINTPIWTGSELIFFARDTFTGLPYRVEVALTPGKGGLSEDDYQPMEIFDLDDDEDGEDDEIVYSDEDRAFLDAIGQTSGGE